MNGNIWNDINNFHFIYKTKYYQQFQKEKNKQTF